MEATLNSQLRHVSFACSEVWGRGGFGGVICGFGVWGVGGSWVFFGVWGLEGKGAV